MEVLGNADWGIFLLVRECYGLSIEYRVYDRVYGESVLRVSESEIEIEIEIEIER
jgi:hypothetical protein